MGCQDLARTKISTRHEGFSSNLQFSINDSSRASVKDAAPLTSMLKTNGSSEVSTPRVLGVNDDEVVGSGGGSIKKSDKSKNFENPKFKTLDARKNSAS